MIEDQAAAGIAWQVRVEPHTDSRLHWRYGGPTGEPGFLAGSPPADLDTTRTYATWEVADTQPRLTPTGRVSKAKPATLVVSYWDGPGRYDVPAAADVGTPAERFARGKDGNKRFLLTVPGQTQATNCGFTPEVVQEETAGFRWHVERPTPGGTVTMTGFEADADAAVAAARAHVADTLAAEAAAGTAALVDAGATTVIRLDDAGADITTVQVDADPLEALLDMVAGGVASLTLDEAAALEQQIAVYAAVLLDGDATDGHLLYLRAVTAALRVLRNEPTRRAERDAEVAALRDEVLHPPAQEAAAQLGAVHALMVAAEPTPPKP